MHTLQTLGALRGIVLKNVRNEFVQYSYFQNFHSYMNRGEVLVVVSIKIQLCSMDTQSCVIASCS
jgi:hypothetical protein